jgi:hypothetical protein
LNLDDATPLEILVLLEQQQLPPPFRVCFGEFCLPLWSG